MAATTAEECPALLSNGTTDVWQECVPRRDKSTSQKKIIAIAPPLPKCICCSGQPLGVAPDIG
eukprot:9694239-Prorocentrum_lima.AAC.1